MQTKTEIRLEDGSYSTPASLTIEIKLPATIGSEMQKKLNSAITDIRSVYSFYKPANNESKKG